MIRGVRGAIEVASNDKTGILQAAKQLMTAMIQANSMEPELVSAVFFTVTPDLTATFPAGVRKQIGWNLVPFLCSQEIPVPGSMNKILRALVLFETDRPQEDIHHCYLGAAASLRPDLQTTKEVERRSS